MGSLTDELLSLEEPCEKLKKCGLPVYLYGTGDGADKISALLERNGVKISGVFASDGFVRDREYKGFRVRSLAEVEEKEGQIAAVLCFGLEPDEVHAVRKRLAKHLFLAPAVPVCGNTLLDRAFFTENGDKAERVMAWLRDELSKQLYRDVLCYSVTGDPKYLFLRDEKEAVLPPAGYYGHDGIHADIGAYDGDTANEFLAFSPDCKKVVAFEPDGANYRKLCAGTAGKRVEPVHAAVGEKEGFAAFDGRKGRGSRTGDTGEAVALRSLDGYFGFPFIGSAGEDVKSVKIDAEGEDANVLFGGANLITAKTPAVCVSAYHRGEDLVELPLLLKRMDYRYALYFRKKKCIPAWDTAFFAILQRNS